MPLSFCMAVEEWVPCSSLLNNSGWSGRGFDVVNTGMYKLTKKDGENASNLIQKYFELNKNIQDLLVVSLQRLNLLRRRKSLVDKSIELGIALEVLLLRDGGPDVPISLPFRLRGAWLLGQDTSSRSNYFRLFKDIYACRCEAVHSGKFDSKFTKKLSLPIHELLKKGDELCVSIIKWIIGQKRFPDWEKLLLGDVDFQENKEDNKIT
jgi:hypothetical protein